MDKEKAEPSGLAVLMIKYLNCPCSYFPSGMDGEEIQQAYLEANTKREGQNFTPVLISVSDSIWDVMLSNSDPENAGDGVFDVNNVNKFRENAVSQDLPDGESLLNGLIKDLKEEGGWAEDMFGKIESGDKNRDFHSYLDYDTDKTSEVILARIPVTHPWKVFAWLPIGGRNECPDSSSLAAIAKYWYDTCGAVPAAISPDKLEFYVKYPVKDKNTAMKLALEQYAFCPDIIEQSDSTVGNLADSLTKSSVWYFWWG